MGKRKLWRSLSAVLAVSTGTASSQEAPVDAAAPIAVDAPATEAPAPAEPTRRSGPVGVEKPNQPRT